MTNPEKRYDCTDGGAMIAALPFNPNVDSVYTYPYVLAYERARLALCRKMLHDLEVAANTVDYCYTRRPDNFAAALRDLRDAATAARNATRESAVLDATGERP